MDMILGLTFYTIFATWYACKEVKKIDVVVRDSCVNTRHLDIVCQVRFLSFHSFGICVICGYFCLLIPFFVLHVFIVMCLCYFLIVLVSFTVFAFLVSFGTKALLVLCIILYEGRLSTSVHIVGSMAISCLSHYFPSLSTNAILLSTTFSFNFFLPLVSDKVMLKHHFCLHFGLRILMLKHDLCQVWAWVCVYIKNWAKGRNWDT